MLMILSVLLIVTDILLIVLEILFLKDMHNRKAEDEKSVGDDAWDAPRR